MDRIRQILSGPASVALVVVMLAGCLFLWVGVPLIWLWIGSQVESSASLGTAMAVAFVGIVVTIVLVASGLAWLNRRHIELQERRGVPAGRSSALEVILVSSAALAVVGFGIWFFGFAGASPAPLNVGF
jgi:heme/copper-type cytochrome/quinol oxidase subunit 2